MMQILTEDQLKVLMAPLNPNRVKNRKQGGASLSYLEGYDVKATLIRVFGFGGFSADVIETKVLEINRTDAKDTNGKEYTKIVALAQVTMRLRIPSLGCTYTETGAASQTGRDVGEVTDFAIKTAATDALKRCAINLGTQFGLGLYNNGSTQEVVRRVFAPGQEWPREADEPTEEQAKVLNKSMGMKDILPPTETTA